MEVHVPSGRPHSLKNFAIELGTITAGILIALTLEALVERHHYRVLADEARETILASALSLVRYGGDPNQASTADLRALRGQILDLQAALYLEEQFGKGLLEQYQKFLEKEK
jgi:hypothetical protein